jgi:type I restriction enzyme S subunit
MTLVAFFEKFDLFTDAPNAVVRMRELVRHLAVTGKLVVQDASDEPGEQLLKKIEAERAAAVKARQISPMKALPEVGKADLSFDLQPGWVAARLIELVMEIQTGPFGSSLHKSDYQLGGTPVINPASLKEGKIVPIDEMAIGHTTLKRLEVFKLCEGDIVMARRGEMGRCAIVTKGEAGWLCGTGSLVLRMPRAMHAPYLAMLIGAPMARTYLGGASVGATMQNLNQSILAKMPVGVPPLAEQKRIVAKVDELMALCDRLEAQQQEREAQHTVLARAALARFADAPTPANLDFIFHKSYDISPADLRKSILTLAVQGKLVPQDIDEANAREMIDRAMVKRQKTINVKGLRRKELDESADLFEHKDLPSSWCVERFANLVDPENTISYGVLVPGNDVPDGIPFVRAQDICLSNHPARPNKTIAPEIEKPYARTRLTGGEILLCVVGSIGKLGVVPDSWAGANIARAVARIKPIPDVLRDYLLLVLQEDSVQNYFKSTTRTLAQPTLNVGMIEQTPIPIPPLVEQRRIVAKVDQLMALVDALETQLADSRATATNLLSALVAELTGTASGPKVSAQGTSGTGRRGRPRKMP